MTSARWSTSTRAQRLPRDWRQRRQRILRRDHHTCQSCGAPATDVDHIVAGHHHDDDNLQSLCPTCHKRKTQQENNRKRQIKRNRLKRALETHPGLTNSHKTAGQGPGGHPKDR